MSRLVSGLSFARKASSYTGLVLDWSSLAHSYPGWSLAELKALSPRERENWLGIANQLGKVTRN